MNEKLLCKCTNITTVHNVVSILENDDIVFRRHDETTDTRTGAYGPMPSIAIYVFEKDYEKALESSKKGYMKPCNINKLAEEVQEILSTGNQTGEGWLLTAEIIEFMNEGIQNIICLQPFACLPNHIVGKGVIKTIRAKFPEANITPVDYDPGASETNQTNRIKLLMTVAKDNLKANKKRNKILKEENNLKDLTKMIA